MNKKRTEIQKAKNRKRLKIFKESGGEGNSKYRMKKKRFGKISQGNPKSPFYKCKESKAIIDRRGLR